MEVDYVCPLCGKGLPEQDFGSHIESHYGKAVVKHLADSSGVCRACGNELHGSSPNGHHSCLRNLGQNSSRDSNPRGYLSDTPPKLQIGSPQVSENGGSEDNEEVDVEIGIPSLPDVIMTGGSTRSLKPKVRLSDDELSDYFGRLSTFLSRERQSAIDEGWQRFNDHSIEELEGDGYAALGLEAKGTQFHPDFDTQFVFTDPSLDEEDGDFSGEHNFYRGHHAVLTVDGQDGQFPIEGRITFAANDKVGFMPHNSNAQNSATDSALTRDGESYHLVQIFDPLPFDREREAVRSVKRSEKRDLLAGATLTEATGIRVDEESTILNQYQRRAIERGLGAQELLCIHGPPGTGKTRTLTELIRLLVADGKRVLACSHSNQAVDNLLAGTSTIGTPAEATLHQYAENEEFEMARVGFNSKNSVVRSVYQNRGVTDADVVGATMSSVATITDEEFDVAVVDEASQASQPASFLPFSVADRIILAGDHKQLPPYCSDEEAKAENMHISLFEHILDTYGEDLFVTLGRQYRMNQEIATFPNQEFYNSSLDHGTENATWTIDDLKPIIGINIQGTEKRVGNSNSKYNPEEAEAVAKQVKLLSYSLPPADIGVITAYSAQKGRITRAIRNAGVENGQDVKVDTIDSFQGGEREAIVVSFVRSNPDGYSGFLSFPDEGPRRLNVAMTRARKRLVLIGNWNTLSSIAPNRDPTTSCADVYQRLYNYLDSQKRILRTPTA
ncbi:DNA polymerase III delta prime subunit [Halobacterium salinarum]|uniref:DNA polymerase III delta prime subunit n=1 Tax=Halobacterium salinarum TaxID=2242 RepID=A0A841HE53_HALSI|nr:AAA domain-containing protein [Halobacterium salinarum]MBB6090854.1 DNA polymerase III delta prime subunit [Halobacterium salinarum]